MTYENELMLRELATSALTLAETELGSTVQINLQNNFNSLAWESMTPSQREEWEVFSLHAPDIDIVDEALRLLNISLDSPFPRSVGELVRLKLEVPADSALDEYPIDSHCGKASLEIVYKGLELLAICDSHPHVVKPIKQGMYVAIEVICFG